MEKINHKKLNFKCGLEIHQQLDTNKLFCSCPSIVDNSEPELRIRRRLRAVAGEKGKKDLAALYEESKNKEFIYEYSSNSACLIELDESPPLEVNMPALGIALQIALLLHATPLKNLKVMRKIIIDGSNITGFQRTTLLAKNGYIETSKGKVRIPTIFLEEDAARKIAENEKTVTYKLDRLGIPLIEITTAPEIKDKEHAKETASLIGMILRSTDRVKRGLGTIRQDINFSISNSPRIEIKGFQDLRDMPKIIEYEINRVLKARLTKPEVRKVNEDSTTSFLRPLAGEARFYPETDVKEIKITSSLLKKIKLPELITKKTLNLEKTFNLSSDLAKEVIKNKIGIEYYIKKYQKLSPTLIAHTLIETPKELKSRFKIKEVKIDHLNFILENLNKGLINKDVVIDVLLDLTAKGKTDLSKYNRISDAAVQEELSKVIKENPNASFNALMGILMSKLKGKVDAKKLAEIIQSKIK